MDLYYRGYDPAARITSGAEHLSAAAARLAVSIVFSIPHLPESAWEELKQMITVDVLWSLSIVFAGWLIATVVGGLVGLAVNAILIIYGLVELWEQIKATAGELRDWALTAYHAQNEADLDTAAQHFGVALTKGGITLLEVLVTHRVFRAVEGKLRQRFPTPDWLSKKYEQAAQRRAEAGRSQEAATKAERLRSVAEKAADVVTSGVRYEGARRAAEDFPTAAVVLGGTVVAIGTVAVAAWAASASTRREPR